MRSCSRCLVSICRMSMTTRKTLYRVRQLTRNGVSSSWPRAAMTNVSIVRRQVAKTATYHTPMKLLSRIYSNNPRHLKTNTNCNSRFITEKTQPKLKEPTKMARLRWRLVLDRVQVATQPSMTVSNWVNSHKHWSNRMPGTVHNVRTSCWQKKKWASTRLQEYW